MSEGAEELSFSQALDKAMGEVFKDINPDMSGDVHVHDADEDHCDCPVTDEEDVDMEIHITLGDEPENGTDYQVKDIVYADGYLPLTINDTPIQIPWRIRIVKLL